LARPRDGWAEALLKGQSRRAAALAALPTLTEVSRASLLCGELRVGGQEAERNGFAALARAHGLKDAPLFHKGPLESARPGYALADDVAAAIVDVTRHPLITCVLNTVDDALDRSDASGIAWGADTVKYLAPLLDRARHAGRIVILTADHGHIVERRQGTQQPHPAMSSNRSRAATPPPGVGEVLVSGRRVLLHDGTAVLAVDENLRYGPLKSGYHGGASPAEVVVPVVVLVPGAVPANSDLRLAPPQEPSWWTDPILSMSPAAEISQQPGRVNRPPRPAPDLRKQPDETVPTLFDEPESETGVAAEPEKEIPTPASVTAALLKAQVYIAHKKSTGRVSITDAQIKALLEALLAAPSYRLGPSAAASALGVSPVLLRGAVLQAQQLLNIDGYAVVRIDADGATVILDGALLAEQYGIRL
jgi:PglZ domain